MVIGADITKHGFEMKNSEYQSVEKAEGSDKPLWIASMKQYPDLRTTGVRIQKHEKVKDLWYLRVKFDGILSHPNELAWVMKSVGVIQSLV